MPPTDVTASSIATLNDTCGDLSQVTPLKRWQGFYRPEDAASRTASRIAATSSSLVS